MHSKTLPAVAAVAALVPALVATGQTLGADFAADYSVVDLGSPVGVPFNLGGITFLDDDTVLIGGSANNAAGGIYAAQVSRDPLTGTITNFINDATLFAQGPEIDGGLAFGPGGVLFYTGFSENLLVQIAPGDTAPTKIIDLDTDPATAGLVANSVGTLQFVPAGFGGAGSLKIASFNGNEMYTLTLAPDGSGTFDVTGVVNPVPLPGGPEGLVYIDDANAGFAADSLLVSEFSGGSVGAYEIDANGDPIDGTRRDFLTGLSGAEGAAIDPVTGDFLFSTFGSGNRVLVVTGFVIPEPTSLAVLAAPALLLRRRR